MMRAPRAWLRRVMSVGRQDRLDRELAHELEAHLEMHIDDNRRLGMSADEARRQALIKLGGVEQVKETYRDRRGLPVLEIALKDLRFALRLMRRSPGFSAVILATLAVGIGANTVMFSVVNTLLLRALPYHEPDRLMSVRTVNVVRQQPGRTAPPDFYAYRTQNRSLKQLDAFYVRAYNLTGSGGPERIPTLIVSAGFLSTLGIQPSVGRAFVRQDEQWGSHRVAILSHGLWQRRFGGDQRIVGQPITLNGEPFVVAGILAPGFSFLGMDGQLFVPMAFGPGDNMNSHSNYFLRMIGRLKPNVTRDQAVADLNAISNAIIAEQSVNQGTAIDVVPLRDVLVGRDVRRALLVLLGAVGFVLLISCANLANLLLARAAVRQREIAVRLALGASRGRLLRQFLAESLLLSLAGGCLGLGLAYLSTDALNSVSQRVLPRATEIRLEPAVLAFTFTVATIMGILLGLAPAAHSLAADVNAGLKEGTRTSDSDGRSWLRTGLVVAEVALCLVLLTGAGLMVKSMYQLLHVPSGFSADGVLTMEINLPAEKYIDSRPERQFSLEAYSRATAFFNDVIERVRALPGAQAVGAINGLPLMGEIWGKRLTFYDRPLPSDVSGLAQIQYRVVAGDYFRALRIRMVSGRAFTDDDTGRAPKVAIVNQELVRRYWDGRDPIGKVVSVNPPLQVLPKSVVEEARRSGALPDNYEPDKFTIVGVADDVLYGGLESAAVPLVYVTYAQSTDTSTNMLLVVRTDGNPLALIGSIREQIGRVDPDQPIANIQTMDTRMAASVAQRRVQMNVLGAFAAMAVLLAAIGIYGVMSYSVTQRSREIGIRLALGAARRDVTGLVLRQGLTMVAAGIGVGLAGALLVTRVLRTLLFGVTPTDPVVFTAIVVLLSATAWLATYVPARRAARLDPLVTLRSE
jgi:putative ABC transport system permease protein